MPPEVTIFYATPVLIDCYDCSWPLQQLEKCYLWAYEIEPGRFFASYLCLAPLLRVRWVVPGDKLKTGQQEHHTVTQARSAGVIKISANRRQHN